MNARSTKKNRSSSARGGRGKGLERQMSADGVYGNHRFMQAIGALVGLPVQIQTNTKEVFEGVLATFGPEFQVVLDWPHPLVGDSNVIHNPDVIKRKMIFAAKDIVSVKVQGVDFDYASRESFAVDSAISKFNGQVKEKALEPWQDNDSPTSSYTKLDDESANGWTPDDMFKENEEKYGVKSSYSADMEEYTTPLPKKSTKEWKEKEALAQNIAQEIQHNPIVQTRAELENGDDEEAKYSAVMRTEPPLPSGSSSGKYVAPQRRKIQGSTPGSGISSNKPLPRGTPSPQSVVSGSSSVGTRHPHSSSPAPPVPSYPGSSQSSSSVASSSSATAGSSAYMASNQHKQTPQQHNLPSGPASPMDSSVNGEPKDTRRIDQAQGPPIRENLHHKQDTYHADYGHPPQHHPHSHHHSQQSYHHGPQYHSSDVRRSESREPRKYRSHKDDHIAELKKFSKDVNITDTSDKKSTQSHMSSQGPPHHHPSQSMQQHHTSSQSSQLHHHQSQGPPPHHPSIHHSQSQNLQHHPGSHGPPQGPPPSHQQTAASVQHLQQNQGPSSASQQQQQPQLQPPPVSQAQQVHAPIVPPKQPPAQVQSTASQPSLQLSHQQQQQPPPQQPQHPLPPPGRGQTQPPVQQQQQQQQQPIVPPQQQHPPPSTPSSTQAKPIPQNQPSIEAQSTSNNSASSNGTTCAAASTTTTISQPVPPPPSTGSSSAEQTLEEKVSTSTLNPKAKEFVFNPDAEPFTPRSPSTTMTPPRPQTPQIAPQMPPVAAGPVGFQPNMVQTYVLPTQPFPVQSQPRFQKRGNYPVGPQRPEYASQTSQMQVAAATGHPLLAPAPLTPITNPQSIQAVQIPQNMMPQTAQPYQYQMMLRFPSLPMMTTMVPTSLGGMYHQGDGGQQTTQGHNPQAMYMGPHQPHHPATPGPHPPQPPTPQGHNAGPAPPHNIPTQPPTPGPTPPHSIMYGGPGGAPMGGQPTIPQHFAQHPHTAQSPHAHTHTHTQYAGHNAAAVAAAAAAASAHQIVMLPHLSHMMPPGGPPPPHSAAAAAAAAAGHVPVPSSVSGYTPTSSAVVPHLNQSPHLHYIPGRHAWHPRPSPAYSSS